MSEFVEFPKISRLSRECVVTEKIDGTNAQVYVVDPIEDPSVLKLPAEAVLAQDGAGHVLLAGSRTRYIWPGQDNHGFAGWVRANAEELWKLGPGRHYGEWWGSGIQRGYGLMKGEKRFSLFNVSRWGDSRDLVKYPGARPACCEVVPILYRGQFETEKIYATIEFLRANGSVAAPGFMQPEGIIIWHSAQGLLFKKTLEKDDEPKGRLAP